MNKKERRSQIEILLQKYYHANIDDVIRYVLISYVGIGACSIHTFQQIFTMNIALLILYITSDGSQNLNL